MHLFASCFGQEAYCCCLFLLWPAVSSRLQPAHPTVQTLSLLGCICRLVREVGLACHVNTGVNHELAALVLHSIAARSTRGCMAELMWLRRYLGEGRFDFGHGGFCVLQSRVLYLACLQLGRPADSAGTMPLHCSDKVCSTSLCGFSCIMDESTWHVTLLAWNSREPT